MPEDETRPHHSDESDSEVEEEEEISLIEVDVTKLTALSPEVISKQARLRQIFCSFLDDS
jgi:translation initiation factor 2 subunit 3